MRTLLLASAALLAASCNRSAPASPQAATQPATMLDRTLDLVAHNGVIDLPVQANDDLVVTVESTGFDPMLEVVPPGSDPLHNDDYQGSRSRSQLTIHTVESGNMRLAVSSFGANASGQYRVTVRKVEQAQVGPTFLAIGTTQTGEVTTGDRQLADGRAYDEFMVLGPATGSAYELRLAARGAVVPLAVVLDPAGRTVNSTAPGVYPIAVPFLHRVQLIQPTTGQAAGYTMSLAQASATPAPAANTGTAAVNRSHHGLPANLSGRVIPTPSNQSGSLSGSSIRLPTGESADVYEFDVTTDHSYAIDAQSTDFDAYLVVLGPDGRLEENDDSTGRDAHLDLRFSRAGRARVVVTAYQAGMSGRYMMKVAHETASGVVAAANPGGAATTAATGNSVGGELAQGDRTLQSGEFVDAYRRSFTRGQPINVRLRSQDFDPYLIIRSPSGHQSDNDDFAPPDRAAGIDIPAAEDGEYTISVTSYQPNERGRYQLEFGAGSSNSARPANPPANPANPGNPGTTPASNPSNRGEGRVFGIFVGITDYPSGVGDLPECANDAIKLAEALRNHGLLAADRQIVLTDAQATRANVRAAFQRAASMMGPNDTFLFFHSGHGSQTQGSRDPREIDGTDESIYLHDGEILDDEMGRLFDTLPSRLAILALDSCFAGGFAKDVITRPGRIGFFSSEEDVESSVAGQFQAGGYLSYFLRTGVAGEADTGPRDGVLTVGELEHFLIVQFGRHATDVEMAGAYQHLVVDRGAVRSTEQLWRYQ